MLAAARVTGAAAAGCGLGSSVEPVMLPIGRSPATGEVLPTGTTLATRGLGLGAGR